jgi:hypothetical protein
MASPPDCRRLLDNNWTITVTPIKPERNDRRPEEEEHLHNPNRKAGLQHPTRLVQVIC